MFVYDLIFRFADEPEAYEYALTDYYCTLSGNNQIIIETLNISETDDSRTMRVTVPYRDSLDEKYNSAYVNQALERLRPHLKAPVEIRFIGEDGIFGSDGDCSTGSRAEDYVLCIHHGMQDLSPICCGHCRGNIPVYLLPPLSEKTQLALGNWQGSYMAYDKLFYATGVGEISAHKMLCNISSPLSKQGLEVCRMLEAELSKPVYYYLYRFYGKQPKRCPVCGGEWRQSEDALYDYKCHRCRIVADKTPNE